MTEPTKMETLLGGADVLIGEETVRVRQLPVKLYPRYLETMDDEPKQVELLCDAPAGWSDKLTPAQIEQIIEAGDRLNADFFERWFQRRAKRLERLAPGALGRMGLPSPTGLPKSPSGAE